MKHLAAYLLLKTGGKSKPSSDDISKLLQCVGIDSDPERISVLLGELDGKNIDELIYTGSEKLATVPAGGAAAPASAPAAAAAGDTAAKEEKKEEPAEESDDDMGFGLFD